MQKKAKRNCPTQSRTVKAWERTIHKYVRERKRKKKALLKACKWGSSEYDEYLFPGKWE